MIKIYVGMALTDAPVEFSTIYHDALKAQLRALPGVEVLDFFWTSHSPTGGDDIEVYNLDRTHVENADLCVFDCSHPSLGLGGEIERREMTSKPFLAFRHIQRKVSRYTKGLCARTGVHIHTYEEVSDIVFVVSSWCESYRIFKTAPP